MSEFYENKIVPITINDLDISLMERVRNLARSKNPKHPWITMSDMEIFESAGLYERDTVSCEEGFNLAAVLLFGKYETIQKYFPLCQTNVIKKDDFVNYNDIEIVNLNQQTGHSFEESDYESFGLIDEKGNLTNAGALLADESPIRHSRLFCTRWNGLDKADGVVDAVDDAEISGSIIILLQEGLAFVKRHSHKMWQKTADPVCYNRCQ